MCIYIRVCIYFVCVFVYMQTPGSSSHSMRKPDRARQATCPSIWKMPILPSFGKPVCPCSPAQGLPSAGSCGCHVKASSGFRVAKHSPRPSALGHREDADHVCRYGFLAQGQTPRSPFSWSASCPPFSQEIFHLNPGVWKGTHTLPVLQMPFRITAEDLYLYQV